MDPQQLLEYIIRPTLTDMGDEFDSEAADVLMLATAAQESHCGYYIHQINGPALGAYQVEPYTHGLVWRWARKNTPGLVPDRRPPHDRLVYDLRYSVIIARLLYYSWGIPLSGPGADDVFQAVELWREYKRRYNSYLGAATLDQFKENWAKYVAPVIG